MKGTDQPIHGDRTCWRAVTHPAGMGRRGMVSTFVLFAINSCVTGIFQVVCKEGSEHESER